MKSSATGRMQRMNALHTEIGLRTIYYEYDATCSIRYLLRGWITDMDSFAFCFGLFAITCGKNRQQVGYE